MEPQRPAGLPRSLESALHQACSAAIEQVAHAGEGFVRLDPSALDRSAAAARTLRRQAAALTADILSEVGTRPEFGREARIYLSLPMHLERMADRGEALAAALGRARADGLPFTDRARAEVSSLVSATVDVLGALRDLVRTWNPILAKHVVEAADRAEAITDEVALVHRDRLVGGECFPRASPVFLSILDNLSSIRRHAREMALDLHREVLAPA